MFSRVLGTIQLDNFIIEFEAWYNGQGKKISGFNHSSIQQALFQHLESAIMHDYLEFEVKHGIQIEAFKDYQALEYKTSLEHR